MSALLALFGNNILPILLAAGVGFALQRALRLDPRDLSQIVFFVFAPALVFKLLVSTDIAVTEILQMVGFAAFVMACVGLLSWLVGRGLRLPAAEASAFVLTVVFMNAGNYGLSLNQFVFGESGLAWASLFFVTSATLNQSVGVYVATLGRSSALEAVWGLLKVPAIYAIPLAMVVRTTAVVVPAPVLRVVELFGSAAVPSMLLLLGMQTARAGWPRQRLLLGLAVALRMVVSPSIAWLAAPTFGLQGVAWKAGILEAAMPTAVFSSLIAIRYDVEPDFVSSVVLIGTLLSPFTLTPLIAILGG